MRWKFPDPTDVSENRDREAIIKRIDLFWKAFQNQIPAFEEFMTQKRNWDLPGWMGKHLDSVHPGICWEFGPGNPGRMLVLTPEGRRFLRPMIDVLLERAPKLEDWQFSAYRLPDPPEIAQQAATVKTGAESFPVTMAHASINEGNTIDLAYRFDEGIDEDLAFRQAFYVTESLMGEEMLDKWIAAIQPVFEDDNRRWVPLANLKSTTDSLRDSVLDQLPAEPIPFRSEDDQYTGGQLRPDPGQEDYPDQSDLLVIMTRNLPIWHATHQQRSFYSERHSRWGEIFGYLKIESMDWEHDKVLEHRGVIEDALEEAMRKENLGTIIGVGTGLRYVYIDLVMRDVPRIAQIAKEYFRINQLPNRSWLLFYDCMWEHEWIGLLPETPEPPRFEEEEASPEE